MHPDGSVSVRDRSKDIIISGGENASSLAIEQELASHPHVLEVSVVARPHIKWGERPMAFVILHPQHAATWKGRHHEFAAELIAHAKRKLPGFACPEWVEVVPELPVGSSQAVLSLTSSDQHFSRKHRRARSSRLNSARSLPSCSLYLIPHFPYHPIYF